jgi:uncharacterized protein YcbX
MKLQVTALTIYPVKSLHGIKLQECTLTKQGLENDRRWMVVRSNGRFMTQRDLPSLALIQTALEADGVVLSREGFGSCKLRFDQAAGAAISSKVWSDTVETFDMGDEVAAWLTAATKSTADLRVVRMADDFNRQQSSAERFGPENATQFADASPYLVANEASLEALNAELQTRDHPAIPMNRFRPNVVVRGLDAFTEHNIDCLAADTYEFRLCEPCERCVVPTINQATAVKDPHHEPFITLTDINPMPGKRTPAFAENAVLAKGEGKTIRVGDSLRVCD